MGELQDLVQTCDSQKLADYLKLKGERHQNYKLYMAMDRALELLLTGDLYLFDGSKWNDENDRKIMIDKDTYARCFSCSTRENVAMWMLYGGERGKNGAMLNFYPSILKELRQIRSIDIGKFDKKTRKFEKHYTVTAENKDYCCYLTDVIYVDDCNDGKTKITLADEHATVDRQLLNNADTFYKAYPWAYERECRLVVRLRRQWRSKAIREELSVLRLSIPEKNLTRLRKDRLVRSPIYKGTVGFGEPSALTSSIDWDL